MTDEIEKEGIKQPSVRKPEGTLEDQRQRRKDAIEKAQGLWKDRTDIPKDGVEYQKQIRSEWDR